MARHNEMGKRGEQLAVIFLVRQGYAILHCNWRSAHYEIDIIAVKNKVLHFIEVKTRSTDRFGYPEASVTNKKLHHLLRAGSAFLFHSPKFKEAQCDILSIVLYKNDSPQYFLIEDVYLYPFDGTE